MARNYWILLALAVSAGACNRTPVGVLDKSFTFTVDKNTGNAPPIKIDFLWVVDNSSSMCQEQVGLARNFDRFVSEINNSFDIDPRLAVTTVDAQCDVNGTTVFASKGKFNQVAARAFPRACQATLEVKCEVDADCGNLDCLHYGKCGPNPGEWVCHNANVDATSTQCTVNPNGSINSYCRRLCTTDDECRTVLDDDQFVCQTTGAQASDRGCLPVPDSAECPDTLPPYLTGENLDLFPCIATVGVNQEKCLKYEQPLRSGLLALAPTGPNSEQAASFLRPDAYLVIVFVTDEDDCSVADGATIGEDSYSTCALLKTTDAGGPLVPVAHYVNEFKALKSDPGKVIVAAIAGDSLATNPTEVDQERQEYVESKGNPRTCYNQTSICSSDNGLADYGARLVELTDGFGPNGSFANICADQGIEVALDKIANTIVSVVNKVCLPRQVLTGLSVKRTRNGTTTVLSEGDGPDSYRVIPISEDCAQNGESRPAIAFSDPPIPGESIEITYEGDPEIN